MEGLPRSVTTFRSSGSSGLVWDNTSLTEKMDRLKEKLEQHIRENTVAKEPKKSRSIMSAF